MVSMPLRTLFFGVNGMFSQLVLEHLLASRHHLCAVLLPGGRKSTDPTEPAIRSLQPPTPESRTKAPAELSLVTPFVNHSTMHVAWEHGIPVFAIERLDAPETLALLRALNPDVACVACFPRRIPAASLGPAQTRVSQRAPVAAAQLPGTGAPLLATAGGRAHIRVSPFIGWMQSSTPAPWRRNGAAAARRHQRAPG